MPYASAIVVIVGAIAAGASAGAEIAGGVAEADAVKAAGKEARSLNERDRRDRLKQNRVTNRLRGRQVEATEEAIGLRKKEFDYKKELGERSIRAMGVNQAGQILENAAKKDLQFKAFLKKQYSPKVGV